MFTRRAFGASAGAGAAVLGLNPQSASAAPAAPKFPKGFRWGCATAAYQIEGAVKEYHWDLPAALPGGWQSRDTAYAFAD